MERRLGTRMMNTGMISFSFMNSFTRKLEEVAVLGEFLFYCGMTLILLLYLLKEYPQLFKNNIARR